MEDTLRLLSDAEVGGAGGVEKVERYSPKEYNNRGRAGSDVEDKDSVESATSTVTVWVHLLSFLFGCVILRTLLLLGVFDEDPIAPALFLVLFCGGTNIFIDMSVIKCLGLVGTFGLLFLSYWVLPEYNGDYYNNYYDMMELVLPIMAPFAAGYIYYVDAHMRHPCDGLYSMGLAMTCRWESVNTTLLSQYLLGWMVKGFFMPLMFVPLCDDIQNLLTTNFRDVVTWGDWYGYLYSFLYFIDLHFANIGYMCTFRLCDTHIRATESTLVGWVAALMCYSPINTITSFYFDYSNDITWSTWLEGYPVVAFMWGSSILILTALYSLAGVYFGIRFSNLTHRGIITSGPYAITKHPAYLFKNISWWMVSVPFAAEGGWEVALKNSIGLLMFNCVYLLRARCEEMMLSADPAYVRYSRYMDKHGVFSSISEPLRKTPMWTALYGYGDRDRPVLKQED